MLTQKPTESKTDGANTLTTAEIKVEPAQNAKTQSETNIDKLGRKTANDNERNAIEELEETAKLYLLLRQHDVRTLGEAEIDELRQAFGAHW